MEKQERFEVLKAVVMRNQVFWDVTPRRLSTSVRTHYDPSTRLYQSAQCHIPEDLNLHGKTCSGSTQSEQRYNSSQQMSWRYIRQQTNHNHFHSMSCQQIIINILSFYWPLTYEIDEFWCSTY